MTRGASRRARRLRTTLGSISVVVGGVALSSCGSSAGALAHQACLHVATSIKLFDQSQQATGTTAANLVSQASQQLRQALRPAALAASESTDWQALNTTLSESSRVPEANLVYALTYQCQASLAGS